MDSWSFRLGRLFGVEVRMHLFFPVLLLLSIFWSAALGHGAGRGTVLWLLLVLAVLVREAARAVAAAAFSLDLQSVLLLPTGGIQAYAPSAAARADRPQTRRVMALVGPFASFVFGLSAAGIILTAAPATDLRSFQWVTPLHLLRAMVWLNLQLGALNLLPAWPLDAGRAMRRPLLARSQPVGTSQIVSSSQAVGNGEAVGAGQTLASPGIGTGPGVALVLVALGVALLNFWLIMAGIGVFLMAQLERGGVAAIEAPRGERIKVKDVMLTEYSLLSASATLEDAVLQSRHTLQDVFPVVRAGNLVGAAARRDVIAALETDGNGYVQGMMTRTLEPAAPDDEVVAALARASGAGSQLVPVLVGERVVGILTPGNLQRAMSLSALDARRKARRDAASGPAHERD